MQKQNPGFDGHCYKSDDGKHHVVFYAGSYQSCRCCRKEYGRRVNGPEAKPANEPVGMKLRAAVFLFGVIALLWGLGMGLFTRVDVDRVTVYGVQHGVWMTCGAPWTERPNNSPPSTTNTYVDAGSLYYRVDDPTRAYKATVAVLASPEQVAEKEAEQKAMCFAARDREGDKARKPVAMGIGCMFLAFIRSPFPRRRRSTDGTDALAAERAYRAERTV